MTKLLLVVFGVVSVRARRACVWAAAYEVPGDGMAPVGREVAEDDRDGFGVGMRARPLSCSPHR
jgi:hypothetical protein